MSIRTGIVRALSVALVAAVPAVVVATNTAVAGPGSAPKSITLTTEQTGTITAEGESLFSARAAVSGTTAAAAQSRLATSVQSQSAAKALVDDSFVGKVAAYRQWLRSQGEAYTGSSTTVDVIGSRVIAGRVVAQVNETTMLNYAKINGGEPPSTGYTALHELVYMNDASGALTLVEDRQLEPSGLLPLGEAGRFVRPSLATPGTSTGRLGGGVSGVPPVAPAESPAATTRPAVGAAGVAAPSVAGIGGYNYPAMATYLEKFWSSYNPAYRNWDNGGVGPGDCTNFVSQALRNGGWALTGGASGDYHYWWYNASTQTKSWAAVDWWASYARSSGRTSMLGNVWDMRVGDVLQIDRNKDGTKDHTMMVSYYSSGPYFTYHSNNRYRRSMNQVLADWGAANYFAYRT